ncbi:MAG: transporter substrate-binding domain-containing protein [Rhodospirillales bacterium]|nr:transporter substrate-binding domain-containing protein [Rhodospirillales bacterium]
MRKSSIKRRLGATCVVAALILFGAVPSFAQTCQPAPSKLEQIAKRGKLLAGVRFDFPPNGYVDSSGKNIGFGPDIAREFAKRLGVPVEFVQTTAQSRIPLILSGAIDAEFGASAPTKPRDEVVDFSYTYIWDEYVIVVREGMSKDPKDYMKTDKTVGVIQGAEAANIWAEQSPTSKMVRYQEYPELLASLANKRFEIALTPGFTARDLLEKLGERVKGLVVGGAYRADPSAIVLPQNDSNWRDWVNWGLQRLWADGTYQKLYRHHYKIDPPFHIWENNQLQPRVTDIGDPARDPWKK